MRHCLLFSKYDANSSDSVPALKKNLYEMLVTLICIQYLISFCHSQAFSHTLTVYSKQDAYHSKIVHTYRLSPCDSKINIQMTTVSTAEVRTNDMQWNT